MLYFYKHVLVFCTDSVSASTARYEGVPDETGTCARVLRAIVVDAREIATREGTWRRLIDNYLLEDTSDALISCCTNVVGKEIIKYDPIIRMDRNIVLCVFTIPSIAN